MTFSGRWHEWALHMRNRPFEYSAGRAMRVFGRSVYVPTLGYFINDAALARRILADPEHFGHLGAGGMGDYVEKILGKGGPLLFNQTGVEHQRQRDELRPTFGAAAVDGVVREALRDQVAELRASETVELVTLTRRWTMLATLHARGHVGSNPPVDLIARLGGDLTRGLTIRPSSMNGRRLERAQAAAQELCALVGGSVLTAALVAAGSDTVAAGLPRAVALLLDHRCWDGLGPDTMESAISECLRVSAPSPALVHGVLRDTELDGIRFRAGRRVMIVLMNILRRPSDFDPVRKQDRALNNLWFGAGAHHCVGGPMTRALYRLVLETLKERSETPRIQRRRSTRNCAFPGYEELTLRLR